MATDAQAKQILSAAQYALHSIYGRDKSTAIKLYGDLRTWSLSGHKPVFGKPDDPTGALIEANAIVLALAAKGGQDAQDAKAISAVMDLPAAQVIKLGGFAPPSTNPKSVSQSFTQSLTSSVGIGIGGFFQKQIWLRVTEVALGFLLLAVGIAKLTNAVPIATKIAGRLA